MLVKIPYGEGQGLQTYLVAILNFQVSRINKSNNCANSLSKMKQSQDIPEQWQL